MIVGSLIRFSERGRAALRRMSFIHSVLSWCKWLLSTGIRRGIVNTLRILLPSSWGFAPPKGAFSLLALLQNRSTKTEGRLILLDQGAPHTCNTSLMIVSNLMQHAEQPWPIFWARQHNAHLVGCSLALRNGSGQLCQEAVYGTKRLKDDPAYWYIPWGTPHRLTGAWTSILSNWTPNNQRTIYAHWIFDALPRLALLSEFPADTRVLVPANMQNFQIESLRLLGLSARVRPTQECNLQIEDYYFSSNTAMVVCYDPYGVAFLRRSFLMKAKVTQPAAKRIFITRRGPFRTATNINELEDVFQQRGWTVLDLATMPFAEQIGLFAGAEAICGVHGAGFANCVWCSPGTKVIEILADRYLSGCYEWLAQTVQCQHHFLIFPSDANYCARVDLHQVEALLQSLGI